MHDKRFFINILFFSYLIFVMSCVSWIWGWGGGNPKAPLAGVPAVKAGGFSSDVVIQV